MKFIFQALAKAKHSGKAENAVSSAFNSWGDLTASRALNKKIRISKDEKADSVGVLKDNWLIIFSEINQVGYITA